MATSDDRQSIGDGAWLSPCRTWRYALTRKTNLAAGTGVVLFIGLNPSTADALSDDPTTRRCVGFARDWGFTRLALVNLYALRATDPHSLTRAADPVGPDNERAIRTCIEEADLVVCAWGARGGDRATAVLRLVPDPHCLGVTRSGAPRHPLYVKGATAPVPLSHTVPTDRRGGAPAVQPSPAEN